MQPPGRIYTPAPLAEHPLNDGRVLWLGGLPEKSGGPNWFDLCGRNHGTLTGFTSAPTNGWAPGPSGGVGLAFSSAVTESVELPATLARGSGDWTAAAWVRAKSYTTSQYPGLLIFDGAGLLIDHAIADKVVLLQGGNNSVSTATAPPLGSWQHVAGTRSGTTYKLYQDGAETTTANSDAGWGFAGQYFVGRGYSTSQLDGTVADVGLWSRALSAAEVAGLYAQALRGYPDLLRRVSSRAWSFGAAAPAGVTTADSYAWPVRVASNRVGPPALRRQWRQPTPPPAAAGVAAGTRVRRVICAGA